MSRILIVCPTPKGGHIEHAANLGFTFSKMDHMVSILTRPGGRSYLPPTILESIQVDDLLPRLGNRRGVARAIDRLLELAKEHGAIIARLRSSESPDIIVLEEPRYPFPEIFRLVRRETRIVMFLHNIVEHETSDHKKAETRLRELIKKRSSSRYDLIVVHGDRQAEALRRLSQAENIAAVRLPEGGWVEDLFMPAEKNPRSYQFVCPGAIRRNKGTHLALEAAVKTGTSLLIAGEAIENGYVAELTTLAQGSKEIDLRNEFIDAGEFKRIVESQGIVVLPYIDFHAQSGILSRAMAASRRIIASDLEALREQAAGYPYITFVRPGNLADLELAFRDSEQVNDVTTDKERRPSESGWNDIATSILNSLLGY